MENEIWKDIKGYEGYYQISNFGRVKSLERKDCRGNTIYERILKPHKGLRGEHRTPQKFKDLGLRYATEEEVAIFMQKIA